MHRTFALVVVVFASACSLLVDTRDLDEGESAPDAAAPPADATSTGESGALSDAAAGDALTEAGDATSVPGCDSLIADSFDVGQLGAQWSSVTGSATLETTDVISPPNALALTIDPDAGTTVAYLRKTFSRAKSLCCDFWARSPLVSYDDSHRLLDVLDESGNYSLSIRALPGKIEVRDSFYSANPSQVYNRSCGEFVATTSWRHIHFVATLPPGAGLGSVDVTVDGVTVIRSELGSASVDLSFDELRLGTDYSQGAPPRVLRFDDVRCSAN